MHKKIFILFVTTLFTTLCFSQTKHSFQVNGLIENKADGKIFLQCYDEKGNITGLTADIKDHKFYFEGTFVDRARATLIINGINASQSFLMDTGKIDIQLKIDTQRVNGNETVVMSASVTGSNSQKIWDDAVEHFGKITRCEAPDSVKSEDYYNAMLALAKEHPELYVTRELLLYNNSWSYEQMKSILETIPKAQLETPLGQKLKKQLEQLRITRPNTYIFFPTQKDVQGKNVTLDDLDFKYLLIDFWAGWCGPCRKEHPGLIRYYNKYKAQGFNILSISLDKKAGKAKWLQAIKEDKLPWKQVSDLDGFQTEIAMHYGLSYIPYNMLIDRNGKILATDLRGEDLPKKLRELFSTAREN